MQEWREIYCYIEIVNDMDNPAFHWNCIPFFSFFFFFLMNGFNNRFVAQGCFLVVVWYHASVIDRHHITLFVKSRRDQYFSFFCFCLQGYSRSWLTLIDFDVFIWLSFLTTRRSNWKKGLSWNWKTASRLPFRTVANGNLTP